MSSNNVDVDASSSKATILGLEFGALAIAIILSIFLSFFERNRRGGRPGVVIPINFLQDDNLAIVYTAAFGCTSIEILNLILFRGKSYSDSYNIHRLVLPWVRVLIWMMTALLASLKFYPVFAVIRCRRIIIEPLIGLFYTSFILSSLVYRLAISSEIRSINAAFLAYIPILICYVILIGYFLYKSARHIYSFARGDEQDTEYENSTLCASQLQYNHVKWLLKKAEYDIKDKYTGFKRTVWARSRDIKSRLGVKSPLRASPRVIATLVVASIILFQVGITLITYYAQLRPGARLINLFSANTSNTEDDQYAITFLTVTDVGFYVSFAVSSIFMIINVIAIFISYRKDLEKMQRGDFTFLPMKFRKSLNDNLVAASLRYSGAQIAFLVWCYILILLIGWILCYVIAYIVILPLMGKVPFSLFDPVLIFVPLLIINFGLRKLQVFLSRRFFLQDFSVLMPKGLKTQKALALDNIKMFNILSFFMFFFHVIIGAFSCISQILIGLVIGLMSLARIDRCMLPRGFEKFDKGYSTYIGMLMVEVHHRNPVASVFCNELLLTNKEKGCANVLLTPVNAKRGNVETKSQKYRRICRKWSKLYTLINNPSIRRSYVDRKSECSIEHVEIAM